MELVYKQETPKMLVRKNLPGDYLRNLLPEEKKVIELKYALEPFSKMEAQDLDLWADALLLKIHAITGWIIPTDAIQNILIDQFKKKLLESYSHCNPDEIEYAFRTYGSHVKEYGKNLNLSIIDEVMHPYLIERHTLSCLEERILNPEKQLPPSDVTDQETIDTAWELWVTTNKFDYIHERCYDILTEKKFLYLSIEQKKELFTKANQYLIILERESPALYKNDSAEFRRETQRRYAKKMAVANLFTEYKITRKTIQL